MGEIMKSMLYYIKRDPIGYALSFVGCAITLGIFWLVLVMLWAVTPEYYW